jgi:DNA-binding response OmpR family regulator
MTRPTALHVADLTLDLAGRRLTRGRDVINLTPKEVAILAMLMRHADRVVTRTRLSESVWEGQSFFNAIDVHIGHFARSSMVPAPSRSSRPSTGPDT